MSRRVAALEHSLGVDLLIRTTRRVEPTTAGRQLLSEVQPLMRRMERALREIPEAEGAPAGRLRISAPRDVGAWLLPAVLGALVEAHPALRPSVELSNRIVDIEGEGFDAALRVSRVPLVGAGLRAKKLGTIRVGVYAAPGYIVRHGNPSTRAGLRDHLLVGLPEVLPKGLDGLAALVAAGDMLLATQLARHGVGVAFLPSFVASEHVASGELVRLLGDYEVVVAKLFLVWPDTAHMPPKLAAFRDEVLRFVSAHPLH